MKLINFKNNVFPHKNFSQSAIIINRIIKGMNMLATFFSQQLRSQPSLEEILERIHDNQIQRSFQTPSPFRASPHHGNHSAEYRTNEI